MAELKDDVSHFTVDGVVAEMVVQVEDFQKSSSDDFTSSPIKAFSDDNKDVSEDEIEIIGEKSKELVIGKKDQENIEIEESTEINKENIENNGNKNLEFCDNKEVVEDTENKDEDDNETIKDTERDDEDNGKDEDMKNNRKDKENIILIVEENKESIDVSKKNNEDIDTKENKKKNTVVKKKLKENTDVKDKHMRNKDEEPTPSVKGKGKKQLSMTYSRNRNKFDETARYPGTNKRKLETTDSTNAKKKMKTNFTDNHPKKLLRNAKDRVNVKKKTVNSLKNDEKSDNNEEENIETDQPKINHKVLRKLPFRQNKNAPDIPDLEPAVFWWNGVGEGEGIKLGEIPEIKEKVNQAKSVRALYRVLFFQWPTNGQDLIKQILDFNGFPFDKSSYEFTKRQSLMKIMLDVTISNMCEMLGLRKGDKQFMINNILDFLLKPFKRVDPILDPSLQPIVLLERIELDDYFDQISNDNKMKRPTRGRPSKKLMEKKVQISSISPVRKTRNSFLKGKMVTSPVLKKSLAKKKDLTMEPIIKLIDSSASNDSKSKATVKDEKQTLRDTRSKIEEKSENSLMTTNETTNKVKPKGIIKKRDFKSRITSNAPKSKKIMPKKASTSNMKQKSNNVNESSHKPVESSKEVNIDSELALADDIEMENEEKSAPAVKVKSKKDVNEKVKKESGKVISSMSTVSLSDSSETESAEETKLVTAQRKFGRPTIKRMGKPLGHFPKISDSIQKANFSALQRLHILLFGASDKADHLKGNILAFGGFPFLEGSDEWKQKHFLLSLLAQNNLREYLNLLCIQYSDDDQPTMINKLMKFLAVPSEDSVVNRSPQIEMEVVSSEFVDKSPAPATPRGKVEAKKKPKKKEEKKKVGPRHRKVLMSEEEARRLEASFAREQRALAREGKAPPPVVRSQAAVVSSQIIESPPLNYAKIRTPVTDPNQLNALLQTVYKRRALKAAGAVISTPNKGEQTRLGDIENIKFLIVTASIQDLEVLHHLIFMLEAAKSRIRKNILDFDGFGFTEDSEKYKERMEFLYNLGYEMSKRISFLLGLSSMQTEIPLQDLNELIMYFLMSPCKTKQVVPITSMPNDPILAVSQENLAAFKPVCDVNKSPYYRNLVQNTAVTMKPEISKSVTSSSFEASTPITKVNRQKARKSFPSSLKVSPVKKVLLPKSQSQAGVNKVIENKSQLTQFNSAFPATQMQTNVAILNTSNNAILNTSKTANIDSSVKFPVNTGTQIKFVNQGPKVPINALPKMPCSTISNIGQILQNPVIIPQPASKTKPPVMKNPSGVVSSPQEFLIQQQTPDGQQKTFKLIRLPPNHPLASAITKTSGQQPSLSPQVQPQVLLTSAAPQLQKQILVTTSPPQFQNQVLLTNTTSPEIQKQVVLTNTTSPEIQRQLFLNTGVPSGLVLMPNNSSLPTANLQPVPKVKTNISVSKPQGNWSTRNQEFILPDKGDPVQVSTSLNNADKEIFSPKTKPPTEKDLFLAIQEVILSANFEDITLRNVIEKVSAQFPDHDLTHRHNYMKDLVKKIIMGT